MFDSSVDFRYQDPLIKVDTFYFRYSHLVAFYKSTHEGENCTKVVLSSGKGVKTYYVYVSHEELYKAIVNCGSTNIQKEK